MDLGTNTFHLLIAAGDPASFKKIAHLSLAVKLGEGGINRDIIQPAAFGRGLQAIKDFAQEIEKHQVTAIKAIATSALRNASNGRQFIGQVKDETGIEITVIDGDTEAAYIYEGVKVSGAIANETVLIMDIGGGSVEFILGNEKQITWKHSFEAGAARLMDLFHQIDPIQPPAIEALTYHLDEKLCALFEALKNQCIDKLIGSSSVFETYATIITLQTKSDFDIHQVRHYDFDKDRLLELIHRLIISTHQQRADNQNIIPVRVDMIVVASILTRYIIDKLNIEKVSMSTYSLKEGVMADMLC